MCSLFNTNWLPMAVNLNRGMGEGFWKELVPVVLFYVTKRDLALKSLYPKTSC